MTLSVTMKHNDTWRNQMAHCPSCGQRTRFSFAGEQRWPARVAEAVGIEPVVRLWHCQTCHSTLSECDLE